jgi:hypothetical protein
LWSFNPGVSASSGEIPITLLGDKLVSINPSEGDIKSFALGYSFNKNHSIEFSYFSYNAAADSVASFSAAAFAVSYKFAPPFTRATFGHGSFVTYISSTLGVLPKSTLTIESNKDDLYNFIHQTITYKPSLFANVGIGCRLEGRFGHFLVFGSALLSSLNYSYSKLKIKDYSVYGTADHLPYEAPDGLQLIKISTVGFEILNAGVGFCF